MYKIVKKKKQWKKFLKNHGAGRLVAVYLNNSLTFDANATIAAAYPASIY